KDQPCRGGDGDRVRQRRRRTGRTALTAGLINGGTRRPDGLVVLSGHGLGVFAQGTAPPFCMRPCARSQPPATSRGVWPALSTRALRERSVPVSSSADTLLSVVSRRRP